MIRRHDKTFPCNSSQPGGSLPPAVSYYFPSFSSFFVSFPLHLLTTSDII